MIFVTMDEITNVFDRLVLTNLPKSMYYRVVKCLELQVIFGVCRPFCLVSNSLIRKDKSFLYRLYNIQHAAKTRQPFSILEAFTVGNNEGYTGNPAGVCTLEYDDDIPDETKQKIANSLNLSVTAFVAKDWNKSGSLKGSSTTDDLKILHRTIRWFTPLKEIPLCGHATLATCFHLIETERTVEKIELKSKHRGILSASVNKTSELVNLHFPANSTVNISLDKPWLQNLAGIILGSTFDTKSAPLHTLFQDIQYCEKESILLLRLKKNSNEKSRETIQKVCPNFELLLKVDTGEFKMQGFVVTIEGETKNKSGQDPNFYSRFFAPHIGINEDIATGVSHTILTPYWTRALNFYGETLKSHQASGRGGDLHCFWRQGEGVSLAGRARILVKGELFV